MIKKSITYPDYNGGTRTRDFWFNLNKAELMEMELSVNGGFSEMMKRISNTNDIPEIYKVFKELILKSYGVRSLDGERFEKDPVLTKKFEQTEAFVELVMELSTNAEAAAEFFNGVIPANAQNRPTLVQNN